MPTFALIAEGWTDQIILERIIDQFCGRMFEDSVYINPLQPSRDATDAAAAPHGGWELVLETCEKRAADALTANDYVVIHLDTDQGDHENFGVPLTEGGKDRQYNDLILDAIAVIVEHVSAPLYEAHPERFLFAISVHSMESWLLLYFFNRDEPKNSMDRFNRQMRSSNKKPLVKESSAYQRIARGIKRKKLMELSGANNSLGRFLAKLGSLSES